MRNSKTVDSLPLQLTEKFKISETLKQATFHLSQLKNIAAETWNEYNQYKTWAFQATMGSGKTTFIHALCDILNVTSAVSSPTFAIINEYTSPVAGVIYHMDWYRIKDEAEAIQAGCEDCIESGNLCLIEWSEKFPQLLPSQTLYINLETINESERSLTILNQLI